MTSYESLNVSLDDGIGRIELNRPEKRNALNRLVVEELRRSLGELNESEELRAIVLSGAGPAFCAGADLAYLEELSRFGLQENMEDSAALAAMFRSIWESPAPVIARVHGPAIAGGCGLAAVCDISIAVREARFGFTEVGIGFIPAVVSAFVLRKGMQSRTRELLLNGKVIDAEEAWRRGLITSVVADEKELDEVVDDQLRRFRTVDREAVRLTKQMLTAMDGMTLDSSLDYAARLNAAARQLPGCREGIRRFLDSRRDDR